MSFVAQRFVLCEQFSFIPPVWPFPTKSTITRMRLVLHSAAPETHFAESFIFPQ